MCSDAPDTSGMNRAAELSAQLGRDAFEWYKGEYERTAPQRDATQARSNAVSDVQLEAMNFATKQAKDMDARNKTVFQPMEDQIVADANTFDTPEKRAQAMAESRADVESGYAGAQDGLQRSLARMEASPNSGQSLMLMQAAALDKAKATAGATNAASKNIEQQGYARKMDAVSLGKGIVGNQATQQQIATSTGNSSTANSNSANAAGMSGAGLMGQGFSTALQGQGQAGNLYGQIAQIQQASGKDGLAGALGGMAGSFLGTEAGAGMAAKGLMMLSDESKKTGTGKPANTKGMLKMVVNTPVDEGWRYDPAKGGPDDDGVPHDGPMAQDVQKTMGDQVAPGGKVIDLISMNGRLMGAIQELNKQQGAIKRKLQKMEMAA